MNSALEFARTVAPLYQQNDWLGLGAAETEEAVMAVYNMTQENLKMLLDEVEPDHPCPSFVSSGRVRVEYWHYNEEPDEIYYTLVTNTAMQAEDGEFYDIYDERWGYEL